MEINYEQQQDNGVPPCPPDSDLIPGVFDYVVDKWERDMYVNAWKTINILEMWEFVKNVDVFMFNNDPRIWTITYKMEQLGYREHSGTSFALTMRNMQYISNHGEDKFKENYLRNRK
jgi:hypothetical protein